jgi:hypothetical protein
MAAPENTAPPRPPSVPADARWDHAQTGFEWTSGSVDGDGRRHGRYRSWTRAGLLHGECDYDHGRVHGKNITYHPDGTVASEADWVDGAIMDSVFYRCATATPEPFAQAAPGAWSVRYCTRDGKTNYTIRYFAQDGSECGPDGNPLPPRPEGVSPDARWFADIERWVAGEIERGTNAQVGSWRWWSATGVLRHEELRDGRGDATIVAQYAPDGGLEKRITRDATGEQRDYFAGGRLSTRYRTDPNGREVYRGSWLPDGPLEDEAVREFDGDVLASVIERGGGGIRTFEAKREGAAMACVLFASDGKTTAASGLVADGKLSGAWRIYDGTGAVRRELDTTALALEHGPTGESLAWRLGEALFRIDAPAQQIPRELAGIADAGWPSIDRELPARITALVAADPLVREYAHAALETSLEDPALAARALPFLARLLAHPSIDRARLLGAVYEICARAQPASEAVAAALVAAWPAIFSAFGPATFAERCQIFALAKLAPVAKADLLALARKDPDPSVRALALDRLTELPDFSAADVQPSLGDKDALVRAAAAIAVGQRRGADATRDVVRILDEALRTWRDLARRFDELPYVETHVLVAVADAIASIGSSDARSLARELCLHLEELDAESALEYGSALLVLAFGNGERPFAKRFLEILDTIAKSKPFWIHEHDAAGLLRDYGLPPSRLALAALVAELRTMHDPEGALLAKLR